MLTLSATPIPRTLQMSLSGLKDLSLIVTPPAGRQEVLVSVGLLDEDVIVKAIGEELARGGQIFVVVPFIREVQPAASRILTLMRKQIVNVRVLQAHGQHEDLEDRIEAFAAGEVIILF